MLQLFWRDEATLAIDIGPVRQIVAHIMDGEVHIYRWRDPDGDDKNVSLPCQNPEQGRELLAAIFAVYGCDVPVFGESSEQSVSTSVPTAHPPLTKGTGSVPSPELVTSSQKRSEPVTPVQDTAPARRTPPKKKPKFNEQPSANGGPGPTQLLAKLAKDRPELGWLTIDAIVDFMPEWKKPKHVKATVRNALGRLVGQGVWSRRPETPGQRGAVYRPGKDRTR